MLLTFGPYSEAVDIVFTNGSWRSTYPPVCICLGHPLNPDNWAAYHTLSSVFRVRNHQVSHVSDPEKVTLRLWELCGALHVYFSSQKIIIKLHKAAIPPLPPPPCGYSSASKHSLGICVCIFPGYLPCLLFASMFFLEMYY